MRLAGTTLSIALALHGALVILFCMVAGLVLSRILLARGKGADWHLLHAGGTSRGILLIALAATVDLAGLSDRATALVAALIVFFVWTSVLAMFVRALTGETGFEFRGPLANRLIFLLYAAGAVTVFLGFGIWAAGLLDALGRG
jgi:hypothetical protein